MKKIIAMLSIALVSQISYGYDLVYTKDISVVGTPGQSCTQLDKQSVDKKLTELQIKLSSVVSVQLISCPIFQIQEGLTPIFNLKVTIKN